jgi:hypothetical protein
MYVGRYMRVRVCERGCTYVRVGVCERARTSSSTLFPVEACMRAVPLCAREKPRTRLSSLGRHQTQPAVHPATMPPHHPASRVRAAAATTRSCGWPPHVRAHVLMCWRKACGHVGIAIMRLASTRTHAGVLVCWCADVSRAQRERGALWVGESADAQPPLKAGTVDSRRLRLALTYLLLDRHHLTTQLRVPQQQQQQQQQPQTDRQPAHECVSARTVQGVERSAVRVA